MTLADLLSESRPKVTKGWVNESGARVRFIYLFTDLTRAFFTRLHAHAERQTNSHHLVRKDYKSSAHFTPKVFVSDL